MPTLQDWVQEQKSRGVQRDDLAAQFKERYGDDLFTLPATLDYEKYKAEKTRPQQIPQEPRSEAQPTVQPPTKQSRAVEAAGAFPVKVPFVSPAELQKAQAAYEAAPVLSQSETVDLPGEAKPTPTKGGSALDFAQRAVGFAQRALGNQEVVHEPSGATNPKLAAAENEIRTLMGKPKEAVLPSGLSRKRYVASPLNIPSRLVRTTAGGLRGLTGESDVGHFIDVSSAVLEGVLDPFASPEEQKQHERDVLHAIEAGVDKTPRASVVQLHGGGTAEEAFAKAGRHLQAGELESAVKSVMPAPQVEAYERTQKQREQSAVGGAFAPAAAVGNLATDIFNNIAGLAEAANSIAGFTVEQEGTRRGEAAYEAGKGLAEMPGTAANLAKGVADLSGSNSLLTMPVSTWMMVADPLRKSVHAMPGKGGAALSEHIAAVDQSVRNAVSNGLDRAAEAAREKFPETMAKVDATVGGLDKLKHALQALFEDGLHNRDPRIAGEADAIVNGSAEAAAIIKTYGERLQSQIAQGKAELVKPNLVPVDVELKGAPARGKAQAAAREARQAAVGAAEQVAEQRQAEIAQAERATDTAEGRAERAGERMGRAEEAASLAGLRAASMRDALQQGLERATPETVDAKLERAAERQAEREGIADRARERHAKANEAYDAANADLDAAQAEEMRARAEHEQAQVVVDALREKAAAIEGKGRLAANAALETATAKAHEAAVRLQEAAKMRDRAALKARDAADVRSRLDLQRAELEAADATDVARAAAEDVRRVQGAGETVSAGRQWARAAEAGDQIVPYDEVLAAAQAMDESGQRGHPVHQEIIRGLVDRAEQLRQEALIAGFDPNASVLPEITDVLPRHQGKTVLELGREIANHITEDNKGGSRDVVGDLEGALQNIGVPEEAARTTAAFLDAEQKLKRAAHMVEREGGVIRRPAPRVKTYVAEGGLLGMAGQAAAERGFAPLRERLAADTRPFSQQLESAPNLDAARIDSRKQGYNTLAKMESVSYPEEKPAPFVSKNPIITEAIDNMYEQFRKAYFPEWELSGDAVEPITKAFRETPEIGNVVLHGMRDLKVLSKDRIAQRMLESVQELTSQLTRSPTVRNAYLRMFTEKAKALNLPKDEISRLRGQFRQLIEDPSNWNAHSKNVYHVIEDAQGNKIWSVDDYATALEKIKPGKIAQKLLPASALEKIRPLDKIRSDVAAQIATEMADAVQGYSVMRSLADLEYAPFMDEGGKVDSTVFRDINRYMDKLVDNERKGKTEGMAFAYSADRMLAELVERAKIAPPEEVAVIRNLARKIKEANIQPVEKTTLGEVMPAWYNEQFRGTDLPVDLTSLHMPASLANAMGAHFSMLTGVKQANYLARAMHELLQTTKGNIVAASVPSLINNDVSNLLMNTMKRGDPLYAAKIAQAGIITQLWLNGAYDKMAPELAKDMQALAKTDLRSSTFIESELKRHQYQGAVGEAMRQRFPDLLRRAQDVDYSLGNKPTQFVRSLGKVKDGLLWAYQEMGDMPFRVEQALHSMRDLRSKIGVLQEGATIDVPITPHRFIRVERLADGRFELRDPYRAKSSAPKVVELDSPEMRELAAHYGNLVQGERFFDYNKIGNFAKKLRTPLLAPFTGIFTWYFSSMDLPIKRGLVRKIMFEGDALPTTDPNIRRMQNQQAFKQAFIKAMLSSQANNMMQTQAGSEELRKIASYAHSDPGTIVARANDPSQAYTRSISPVIFAKPTLTMLQAGEAALAGLAGWYSGFTNDPVKMQALLTPTAEELEARKQLPQSEQRTIETTTRELRKMITGQTFTLDDFLTTIGAAGAPIMTLMYKVRDGKISDQAANAQLLSMLLGKTPSNIANVILAGTGKALDSPEIIAKSTYASPGYVAGMRGGVTGENLNSFPMWAMNTLLGLGWHTTDILSGANEVTGRQRLGAIANVMSEAEKNAKDKWLSKATTLKAASMLMDEGETRDAAVEKAEQARDELEKMIKGFFKDYKRELADQYKALR